MISCTKKYFEFLETMSAGKAVRNLKTVENCERELHRTKMLMDEGRGDAFSSPDGVKNMLSFFKNDIFTSISNISELSTVSNVLVTISSEFEENSMRMPASFDKEEFMEFLASFSQIAAKHLHTQFRAVDEVGSTESNSSLLSLQPFLNLFDNYASVVRFIEHTTKLWISLREENSEASSSTLVSIYGSGRQFLVEYLTNHLPDFTELVKESSERCNFNEKYALLELDYLTRDLMKMWDRVDSMVLPWVLGLSEDDSVGAVAPSSDADTLLSLLEYSLDICRATRVSLEVIQARWKGYSALLRAVLQLIQTSKESVENCMSHSMKKLREDILSFLKMVNAESDSRDTAVQYAIALEFVEAMFMALEDYSGNLTLPEAVSSSMFLILISFEIPNPSLQPSSDSVKNMYRTLRDRSMALLTSFGKRVVFDDDFVSILCKKVENRVETDESDNISDEMYGLGTLFLAKVLVVASATNASNIGNGSVTKKFFEQIFDVLVDNAGNILERTYNGTLRRISETNSDNSDTMFSQVLQIMISLIEALKTHIKEIEEVLLGVVLTARNNVALTVSYLLWRLLFVRGDEKMRSYILNLLSARLVSEEKIGSAMNLCQCLSTITSGEIGMAYESAYLEKTLLFLMSSYREKRGTKNAPADTMSNLMKISCILTHVNQLSDRDSGIIARFTSELAGWLVDSNYQDDFEHFCGLSVLQASLGIAEVQQGINVDSQVRLRDHCVSNLGASGEGGPDSALISILTSLCNTCMTPDIALQVLEKCLEIVERSLKIEKNEGVAVHLGAACAGFIAISSHIASTIKSQDPKISRKMMEVASKLGNALMRGAEASWTLQTACYQAFEYCSNILSFTENEVKEYANDFFPSHSHYARYCAVSSADPSIGTMNYFPHVEKQDFLESVVHENHLFEGTWKRALKSLSAGIDDLEAVQNIGVLEKKKTQQLEGELKRLSLILEKEHKKQLE